ncbi:GNAT family N-acetyltransferase [Nonomuraea gerenzanensis]|uniref:Acetyltransferase, GNAT family n=1 Tax=Nonomuraea gerenzanensis TaxID=93944 RepID=A0A1M4E6C7_9ACTN|nr:GNAT family N-acetyltransferase [Nonomuraea gerenzanensis]UBU16574.1 GNAT family N-acetyltransferase [Nonomuraea gerenzanensis]SBO94401.1 acetyltransferase, GNAT family [Nonomuraea gerenzanensis]
METERLIMRRWREADREPFAAMNADPEVMEHFPAPLTRAQSDELVDKIEAQFDRLGYSLWALEVRESGEFIGFTGLALQTFEAPFLPAVEIGWRLARPAWGHGYAIEAARRAARYAFEQAGLDGIISMTAVSNVRSQAVMRRLGMTRDPAEDFDHPRVPEDSPLRRHVLYRLRRS